MKQHIYHFLHKAACLALLWVCLAPAMGHAQGGITVYSDTVSVLEDAADDSVRQSPAVVPGAHVFSHDVFDDGGVFDFLSGIMGMTGILLILASIVAFLLPLLAVALIAYLIYRSSRNKRMEIEREAYDPARKTVDEEKRSRLLKQSAIKYACWGVGLIAVEWIIDLTSLLHVAGVVLLCIAAGDWLTALVSKKKEPH